MAETPQIFLRDEMPTFYQKDTLWGTLKAWQMASPTLSERSISQVCVDLLLTFTTSKEERERRYSSVPDTTRDKNFDFYVIKVSLSPPLGLKPSKHQSHF
jgi:hypothetical protein